MSLSARGHRAASVALIAVGVSLAIEATQLVIPGRHPNLRDVAMNAAGAYLGAVLSRDFPAWLAAGPGATRRFIISAGGAVAAVSLTGWLLAPGEPTPPLYGQLAPRLGHLERWLGRVHVVTFDGRSLPNGPIAWSDSATAALARGAVLSVDATLGPPTAGLAPIAAVADAEERHLLMLGQDGLDAAIRVHRRAQRFRFDAPDRVLRDAFADLHAGERVALQLEAARDPLCLWIAGSRQCAERFAMGAGWSLLHWSAGWPRALTRTLDALATYLLLLPAAVLAFRVPRRVAVAGALATSAAIVVIGAMSGLAMPGAAELLAAAAVAFTGATWRPSGRSASGSS